MSEKTFGRRVLHDNATMPFVVSKLPFNRFLLLPVEQGRFLWTDNTSMVFPQNHNQVGQSNFTCTLANT
jgi:hypothetical protein